RLPRLLVELPRRYAELAGIAANLVEGDQAGVDVEGRVLDALGGHRSRGLLEARHQLGRVVAALVQQPQPAEEPQQLRVQVRPAAPGLAQGCLDAAAVGGRDGPGFGTYVSPVDGQAG